MPASQARRRAVSTGIWVPSASSHTPWAWRRSRSDCSSIRTTSSTLPGRFERWADSTSPASASAARWPRSTGRSPVTRSIPAASEFASASIAVNRRAPVSGSYSATMRCAPVIGSTRRITMLVSVSSTWSAVPPSSASRATSALQRRPNTSGATCVASSSSTLACASTFNRRGSPRRHVALASASACAALMRPARSASANTGTSRSSRARRSTLAPRRRRSWWCACTVSAGPAPEP